MRKSIILLCVMILMPLTLQAAKVTAKVVDTDNKPLQNVDCKLVNKTSGMEMVSKSNKKGEVVFDKVEAGDYVLQAFLKGYFATRSGSISVADKDTSITLQMMDQNVYKTKESEANELLTQKKFREAAASYKEMLKLTPDDAVVWSNLSKASAGMMDRQAALDAAKKAAELNPKDFESLKSQIQAWVSFEDASDAMEKKNYPEAVKFFTESLKAQPNNPDTYYNLSLAYGHQRNYPEALKNIDEALKLKPNEKAYLTLKRILENNAEADKK